MTALRQLIDQLADIRRDGFEIGMVVSDASVVLGHLYKVRLRSESVAVATSYAHI